MNLAPESSCRWLPLLTLTFCAGVMAVGDRLQAPPFVHAERSTELGEADTAFSPRRAMGHVEVIAGRAHPTGTPANAEVRDYLVGVLQDLGAEVEVQHKLQVYAYAPPPGHGRFAFVDNVIARWPGQQPGPALLLMAHYDSVAHGPGAGDNASGVAALLEVVRALRASGQPMRNPLMVLFTDGEEIGMLGAQAFFGHHPWAKDVALVLNFDSRGSRGPVYMYQTTPDNGELIDAMARFAPAPFANSLISAIFQKLPNPTDLSIAAASGKAGMNFAFIDGFFHYHGPTDTPDRLASESLLHMGSFAMPFVRHFGEVPLPPAQTPDLHYFNPLGTVLIRYPAWLDGGLWIFVGGVILMTSVRALRKREFGLLAFLRGLAGAALLLAVPALFVVMLDRWLDRYVTRPEILARADAWFVTWALIGTGVAVWLQGSLQTGIRARSSLVLTAVLVVVAWVSGPGWTLPLVAAVVGAALALVGHRPVLREPLVAAGQCVVALIALGLLLQVPGAAHILLWPLLAVSGLQAWRSRAGPHVWLLALLPAAVLLGGTARMLNPFIGYALPIVPVGALLLLFLLAVPLLASRSARSTGLAVGGLGGVVLAALVLTRPWSVEHPQPASLFALYELDPVRAYWASEDAQLTTWHSDALGLEPQATSTARFRPDSDHPLWLAPVEGSTISAPRLEVSSVDPTQRNLHLRLYPGRIGDRLSVWLAPDTDLRGWAVDDQVLPWKPGREGHWTSLTGFAVPEKGVALTLNLGPGKTWPDLMLTDVRLGLPDGMRLPPPPRSRVRGAFTPLGSTVLVRRIAVDARVDHGPRGDFEDREP